MPSRPYACLEPLEYRTLMAMPWTFWNTFVGLDRIVRDYPWLNGGGKGVAVIDKGIDYWHPQLGGDQARAIKSPRTVNIWDFQNHDGDPFPSVSESVDYSTAHGTGVAGILAALPFDFNGYHTQGILQNSSLYNLRIDPADSQGTITRALKWVLQNHKQYNITAVNLTDFVGTAALEPQYAAISKALWDEGVFVATPLANTWNDPKAPRAPVGFPGKDPYIFGIGGVGLDGAFNPMTQRGPGLDLLGPSDKVTLIWYTPDTQTHSIRASGTGNSWATPYVVGTAVLMQQIDPTIRPDEIMRILQTSGSRVRDPDGTGKYVRLDMHNAVRMTYQLRDDVLGQGLGNHIARRAASVRLRRGAGAVTDMKLLVGAPDWYSITVPIQCTTTFSLGYSVAGQRAGASLYSGKGRFMGSISRRGLTTTLGPGTYYVQVTSGQSLPGTYSLNVRLAP